MKEIETLSLPDAKLTLKSLKSYQDISKKVGRRWKAIFSQKMKGISTYVVEYFPSVDEDFVYEKSLPVFKKFFGVEPKRQEIVFVKKENILGWMKIFKDDNLVDLSFKRVVNKLKI